MILIIDNYDSFVYNLYQMVGAISPEVQVVRNDTPLSEIQQLRPTAIILSPGPGKPSEAGICTEVVTTFGGTIPILGVCLGHQAIFEAFGGTVSYAKKIMHGKSSTITVDQKNRLFAGLPETIQVARYHSLAGIASTLPDQLTITATTLDDEIMAISHKQQAIFGVQFHPESFLTSHGREILQNFLESR